MPLSEQNQLICRSSWGWAGFWTHIFNIRIDSYHDFWHQISQLIFQFLLQFYVKDCSNYQMILKEINIVKAGFFFTLPGWLNR